MSLNASLDAALRGAAPLLCVLTKIELPSRTIRVLDGAGQVAFGDDVYTGEDAVYGTLSAAEAVVEGVATEGATARFTFLPASLPALSDLTNPLNQGAPVWQWVGAVNPQTGLLIGTPELIFFGEIDTADPDFSETQTLITFEAVSAWERLFEASEGQRLNNSFHQSVWPGERGFEFVTQIQRDEPWGYSGSRPRVVADTNGGRAGGGGGSPPPTGGGRGGGGCAAPETPFLIAPDVTVPSGEIGAGDLAWTRHHLTGEWGFHRVLQALRLEGRERWRVEFADGRQPYIATPDHIFETGDFAPVAWTRLDALRPGAVISGPEGGEVVWAGFHDHGPVIRFSVEDAQSYVSGGLQNHNKMMIEQW